MDPRFITKHIHALLDYPVAFALIAAPFVLPLGESHPAARWLALTAGITALLLTVLTNHRLGVMRVVPYPMHVAVDGLVGLTFLIAPLAMGFAGLDAWFYWLNGGAVATVVLLSKPAARQPVPAPAA